MAQHQVDTALGRQLDEVAQVALESGDPVGDALLVGTTSEGGESVGAGVDDGDPVAPGSHPDREPAGAAADVEDLLLPGTVGRSSSARTASHTTAVRAALRRCEGALQWRAQPSGVGRRSVGSSPRSRGCGATACAPFLAGDASAICP